MTKLEHLAPVIAHRGASARNPENTITAMRDAYALGARWVEFDIQLTSDKVPIVFHDSILDRTSSGYGEVCYKSVGEIEALDAGSWFSPEFSEEHIPTLRKMIACLEEFSLCANIDIKTRAGYEEDIVHATLSVVESVWPASLPLPLFSSFSVEVLRAIRRNSPDAQIGMLMHAWDNSWKTLAEELSCVSVHCHHKAITKARADEVHKTGRKVLVYTVDKAARAKRLYELGVDAIFTNYPDVLLKEFSG